MTNTTSAAQPTTVAHQRVHQPIALRRREQDGVRVLVEDVAGDLTCGSPERPGGVANDGVLVCAWHHEDARAPIVKGSVYLVRPRNNAVCRCAVGAAVHLVAHLQGKKVVGKGTGRFCHQPGKCNAAVDHIRIRVEIAPCFP